MVVATMVAVKKGKRHFLLRRWLDHSEYSPAEGTGPIAWCAMR